MNRVIKNDGTLIATGSFWEGWHGNSCFHFTPGGINLLCQFAGFQLLDIWSGWGFIPSVATHALGLRKFKRITCQLQKIFDFMVALLMDADILKKHKFRTSGSFGFFAKK